MNGGSTYDHAVIRRPADTFPQCIRPEKSTAFIDYALACRQHAAYASALCECGVAVSALPPDPRHPDSCFVEDPVVVIGDTFIRIRIASRRKVGFVAKMKFTEAITRLREGNLRFVDDHRTHANLTGRQLRDELLAGQSPFAVVVGCSDSRVPAEIVFDQGLGDLFVVRVAGNIVAPSQLGSVEFAVEQFRTPLVVVLGHTHCGAVRAAVESLQSRDAGSSPNIRSIVDRVTPALLPLWDENESEVTDALVRRGVRANVRASVEALRNRSTLLKTMADEGAVHVMGAEYALETGLVEFLEDE